MRYLSRVLILFFLAGQLSAWSAQDYSRHDFESFSALKEAHEEINPETVDLSLLNAAIFYETNRQRVQQGLKPFLHSSALEKAAYGHSKDMAELNFFSHQSPVAGKGSMQQRLARVGITRTYMAENIADHFLMNHPAGTPYQIRGDGFYYQGKKIRNRTYLEMAEAFLIQWMNSPGHRRNILDPRGVYLGCGSALYGSSQKPRFKATQNFSAQSGD